MKIPKYEWCGMCCTTERDKIACASWFKPFIKEDWEPIAAQVRTEVETDKDVAIRVVFKTPTGQRLVTRNLNKRGSRLTFQTPTPAILEQMHLKP